jgi:ParB family transcriptional regulator, chromosome partitioning protein
LILLRNLGDFTGRGRKTRAGGWHGAGAMELELHQLDLRYAGLRRRSAKRDRAVLASLAEIGQQVPVVVLQEPGCRAVLLDGYKRVRALERLGKDTVQATAWALPEADALVLERLMRSAEAESALEQGWLLRELSDRFALSGPELARRFDKSLSWVSRRLALVRQLPESIQGTRCTEPVW